MQLSRAQGMLCGILPAFGALLPRVALSAATPALANQITAAKRTRPRVMEQRQRPRP